VLLKFVVEADEELLKRIKQVLQNWDAERVAIIDMILLKMAVAEFLEFDSIPPQVTLNEYLDISKLYSTPKSKEFLNGVLDRLLKELQKEGLVG
jgi:N utilization substance protein B